MFNMPLYAPSAEVVCNEGSFSVTGLECFDVAWDAQMPKEIQNHETSVVKNYKGKYVGKHARAVTEALLPQALCDVNLIMDELFCRVEYMYGEKMDAMECKFQCSTTLFCR